MGVECGVGVGRSPSTFVYARVGRAAARAGDRPATLPRLPTPLPRGRPRRGGRAGGGPGARRMEDPVGPVGPVCPVCARTDRGAGADGDCRTCRQFLEATAPVPPDPPAAPAPGASRETRGGRDRAPSRSGLVPETPVSGGGYRGEKALEGSPGQSPDATRPVGSAPAGWSQTMATKTAKKKAPRATPRDGMKPAPRARRRPPPADGLSRAEIERANAAGPGAVADLIRGGDEEREGEGRPRRGRPRSPRRRPRPREGRDAPPAGPAPPPTRARS